MDAHELELRDLSYELFVELGRGLTGDFWRLS